MDFITLEVIKAFAIGFAVGAILGVSMMAILSINQHNRAEKAIAELKDYLGKLVS